MTPEQAESQFSEWVSSQFGDAQIPADEQWHNFDLHGERPGSKHGSAKLTFGDHIEGVFKDFRTPDDLKVWRPGNGTSANFTDEERSAWAAEIERKAAEKKKAQKAALTRAMNLYKKSGDSTAEHPYLVAKGITTSDMPYLLKHGVEPSGQLKLDRNDLLVPLHNVRTGKFQTYQRIKPDGSKLFPKDSEKEGAAFIFGSLPSGKDGKIIICEGYATGYAISLSVGERYCVVSALDCGNLIVVAKVLKEKFPLHEFIIAADNDTETAKKLGYNPGVKNATKAALAIGRKIAVPPPGDFWDLWRLAEGEAAVKERIEAAVEPDPVIEEQPSPNESPPPPAPDEDADIAAADVAVANLNKSYALVIVGDKVAIMKNKPDEGISFINVSAFETWFTNRFVRTRSGAKKPLGKFWMAHSARRQYEGLVFSPNREVPGHYNLWHGFAVKPKPGDCSKFLAHIRDNICSGDEKLYNWVIGWFADIMQNLDKKNGTSLVLRGKQGTGKTIVGKIIGSLLGNHYFAVSDPRLITGRFNAHLTACLLLHADEAFWAGDHAAEGKLKDLVTGDDHYIEFKGKEVIRVRNYVRLLVSGNPDWLVPAAMDERRSAVIDVGEGRMQDNAYFAAIQYEADNGGREALLDFLLKFDLKSVNLRKIPTTEALLDQKILSMTAEQKWWFDTLSSGELPGGYNEAGPGHCPVPVLFSKYVNHASRQGMHRKSIETQIGMLLHKYVPGLRKLERRQYRFEAFGRIKHSWGYIYAFPSLVECRKIFADEMKQELKWDNQTEWAIGALAEDESGGQLSND